MSQPVEALENEIEHLRAQLAEAEQTLEAIRIGEVDAVLVEGVAGPQVYTLQTPDQPYRAFLEAMNEGAACISKEGIIVFCNQRLAETMGRPAEKIAGSAVTALVPPSAKQSFEQLLQRGQDGEAKDEVQFQREDGSLVPILVSLKAIPSEQGEGLYLIATDLTAGKRAEAALAAERQKFGTILNELPPYILLLTADYHVAFANQEFRRRFGESHGRKCYEFLFNRTAPCEICETYKVLKTNAPGTWEWTGPDGRRYDVYDIPFTDTDGTKLILEMGIDVTERKQAQDAVKAERQRFESVLDNLPVMVALLTPDYRVAFANQMFEKQFGKADGRKCYEHRYGQSAPCSFCETFNVLKTNAPHIWEVTNQGRVIHVFDFPFVDTDGSRLILEVDVDVTEQRQVEEKLRQSSRYVRSLIEASLDPLVTINREGKVTDVNEATEKVTGVPRERLIGSDFSDYFTESDKARQVYQRVFAEGAVRDYPLAIRSTSGQVIDVLYHASVFRSDAGEIEGVFAAARDVTAQKLAEQKLRELAALLDLAHDAIILSDLNGRILFWSRGATDTYGFTAEEAVGHVSKELLHTEFPNSRETILSAIETTREWEGELYHTCRNGSRIVVASRWSLLRDERGQSTAILEINRDVTARKRAEEALRKVSGYTRSLIEASLDPLATISRDGKITDVNESTEKITGLTRHELIGSDFSNYFTEPDKARAGYQQVFATGLVRDYPLAIRHTSGQTTDVLYNATVYRNPQGEVEGVFAAARDITERKRAEAALQKASMYTRSLIEASLDPLVTINREGKITDVNEATEKITGVARERLIGTDFSNYFTEPEMARQGYQRVFAEGSVRDYPLAIRHVSGDVADVLYNANLFKNERNEVEGVFAAARDVTERKRAEAEVHKLNEELEQRVATRTEELQAVNKELEAFNYAVAHDLRAPLRHIHGFAEILTDEAKAALDESARHHLQMILDSVQHMSQLLEDLLRLSRLGRQELAKQVCGLKLIVDEVLNELKPEIKDRNVEWRIGELPFVECDPALMKLVITNLLTNALKFTRPRPQAVIEIGQIVADGEPAVFVRDNGVGFNMKYANKLFTLFQRLHRQQDFEGTGVGLAIVQRIIHKHGGKVWAEGELNKGATFYFKLHSGAVEPASRQAPQQVA